MITVLNPELAGLWAPCWGSFREPHDVLETIMEYFRLWAYVAWCFSLPFLLVAEAALSGVASRRQAVYGQSQRRQPHHLVPQISQQTT